MGLHRESMLLSVEMVTPKCRGEAFAKTPSSSDVLARMLRPYGLGGVEAEPIQQVPLRLMPKRNCRRPQSV